MSGAIPALGELYDAAARIAGRAQLTPVLRDAGLDQLSGAQLYFKAEHLQRGGAFKFRGACNAVWSLPDEVAKAGVVTHSSGNHGQALALAAAERGIPAHVVVPEGAVQAKLAAMAAAGAKLYRCAPTIDAREAMSAQIQAATGAQLIHPYANRQVIAGQGTVALELLAQAAELDAVLMPIGGGGLAAGISIAASALRPAIQLWAAEPAGADDAARSLGSGVHQRMDAPDTICDGLRATLGAPNFEILRQRQVQVLTVTDEDTIAAMRLLWTRLKQVVEPSSATVLAAILRYPQHFQGRRIGVVLSGGNVDLESLPWQP